MPIIKIFLFRINTSISLRLIILYEIFIVLCLQKYKCRVIVRNSDNSSYKIIITQTSDKFHYWIIIYKKKIINMHF